jgi:hypothetical protein
MKIPDNVRCIPEADLLLWRPGGVLNESVVDKILVYLGHQERKFGRPFHRFTDMSALEGVDLSFKYVFHVALYRRLSRLGREPVRSAFFVTNPEVARYVKLHALMTDYSPLKVAMFKSPTAAAKWLGVNSELLHCEA